MALIIEMIKTGTDFFLEIHLFVKKLIVPVCPQSVLCIKLVFIRRKVCV